MEVEHERRAQHRELDIGRMGGHDLPTRADHVDGSVGSSEKRLKPAATQGALAYDTTMNVRSSKLLNERRLGARSVSGVGALSFNHAYGTERRRVSDR
jgi:hypothetical protein